MAEIKFSEIIRDEQELEAVMATPSAKLLQEMSALKGDLMILGAAGKMGVTLALLAKNAIVQANLQKRLICVSRFSDAHAKQTLQQTGIETIACDLLDEAALDALPDAENIIYMAGMKFGTNADAASTWAINTFLPGLVARRFQKSRIVLFSTGNVYPMVPVDSGGCRESDFPEPTGEYAQSALGRERIFTFFSKKFGIPGVIYRLNYAIDLRYGVLLDIAEKVYTHQPVNLQTGFVNVIWQGDANAMALRCLAHATTPPLVLNVTGEATLSVRNLAERFGELFGTEPRFEGQEAETAFLSNASQCRALFGEPTVSIDQMVRWIAHWVKSGQKTLGKPTHFEVRSGVY